MYFKRLLELRVEKGKEQKDIAKLLHCTVGSYGRYERGDRDMPVSMFIILSDYYDVSVDYIVGEIDTRKRYLDV